MDRLNVKRQAGIIPESCPHLLNALIHSPLKINVGFVPPEFVLNFVPGHNLTGAAGKQDQEPEGLWRQLDSYLRFTQLFGVEIQLEDAEAKKVLRGAQSGQLDAEARRVRGL